MKETFSKIEKKGPFTRSDRKNTFFLWGKYFDFSKLDKKNVQN
jgi:hypothetical protein